MDVTEMVERIEQIIENEGDITHGIAIRHFGKELVCGDSELRVESMNVALLVGSSPVFAEAVQALRATGEYELGGDVFLCAMMDGTPMAKPEDMPWATEEEGSGSPPYEKTHFFPLLLQKKRSSVGEAVAG